MFCTKCGGNNSDTATYCRKCGTLLEGTEVETRVASRPAVEDYRPPAVQAVTAAPVDVSLPMAKPSIGGDADTDAEEAVIFEISPTMLFVKAGYVAAAIAAIVIVALTAAFLPISSAWAVLIGLLVFLVPAYFHLMQKTVSYKLTDSKLQVDRGIISRSVRNIPIRRIQDVTVTTDLFQRLLRVGDVVVDNASEDGGKVVIKNIDTPNHFADVIMRQMRRIER